jgi:hypothetical protein
MIPKFDIPLDEPLPEVVPTPAAIALAAVPAGESPAAVLGAMLLAEAAAPAQAPPPPAVVDLSTQESPLAHPEAPVAPPPPAPPPEPAVRRVYVPAPRVAPSPPTPQAAPARQRSTSGSRNRPAPPRRRRWRRRLGIAFVAFVLLTTAAVGGVLLIEVTNPDLINLDDNRISFNGD